MHLSDVEILKAIKTGNDNKALSYLYKKVLPIINAYVCKNGGNKDDAYDAFQDGVTVFYRYVMSDRYQEKYDIQGFIFTICRNQWINKVKHDKRTIRLNNVFDIEDAASFENDIINNEREKEVAELLAKLGERCEELLTYAFYKNLSPKEICDKMGFANEDAVKTKKYKCKQRLLEIIKESTTINSFEKWKL